MWEQEPPYRWALHYEHFTILSRTDLDDPAIRAAYMESPRLIEITPYDPTAPDLDAEREARHLAGYHID